MDIISSQKLGNILRISFAFLFPLMLFAGTIYILLTLVGSQPLGHDESVYLTKARSWMQGTPADEFGLYRPIGMAGFGWIFLHFGSSEHTLRFFGVIFGSLSMIFLYLLFRRVINSFVALSIVGVVTSSFFFLQEAPLFQNDIPSAGFLFGFLYSIYCYIQSFGKSKLIYFAPVFAALAFYTRYGSVLFLVVIVLLSLTPPFLSSIKVNASGVPTQLKTILLLLVAFFGPHFIYAYLTTGSIVGILSLSGKVAGRKYFGEGIVSYLQWLPHDIGGWLLGVMVILGVLVTCLTLFIRGLRKAYIDLAWLGSIGIISFILTGLLVHPEARYIFFPVILLAGVGISGVYYIAKSVRNILGSIVSLSLILTSIYFGVVYYNQTRIFFHSKELDRYRNAYVQTSKFILDRSSSQGGCAIWAVTTYRPAISWYSRCQTFSVTNLSNFERDYLSSSGMVRYSVVLDKVASGQVNKDLSQKWGVNLKEIYRTNNLSHADRGDIIVYELTKQDDSSNENGLEVPEREWIEL